MPRCIARVPPSTHKKEATRCEKGARMRALGLLLCRHHGAKAKRGGLEVWAPALERRSRS